MSAILEQIENIEKSQRALKLLCGEMIATMILDANRSELSDKLFILVESWQRRFEQIKDEYK